MFRVPVTSSPNQTIFFTATINGENKTLELILKFMDGTYWTMDIRNHATNETYLTAIPLVAGNDPAQNLIEAYDYMRIGSAYIVPTDNLIADGPTADNLGTSWALLWDDNYNWQDPKGQGTEVILVWEDPPS